MKEQALQSVPIVASTSHRSLFGLSARRFAVRCCRWGFRASSWGSSRLWERSLRDVVSERRPKRSAWSWRFSPSSCSTRCSSPPMRCSTSRWRLVRKCAACCKLLISRWLRPHQRRQNIDTVIGAAGIAPASPIPQVVSRHDFCVEQGCEWLHYVCTEAALQELVAAWHGLAPEVREKIVGLARSSSVVEVIGIQYVGPQLGERLLLLCRASRSSASVWRRRHQVAQSSN